jgi:tRNA U38,U39,U40 pseudouridine synthase TruA
VGLGRADIDTPARALAARSRSAAGPTAPARGLYFEKAVCTGDQSPLPHA